MKNLKVGDSCDAIKQTRSLLPWRVTHLPYPRETEERSCLGWKWVSYGKMKLPTFFFQKKTLEKQGQSVNYDLFCDQMETLLNRQEAEGYELSSIQSTHSGSYSVTTTQKQPHHQFLKNRPPSHQLQGRETFILIFKRHTLPKTEA